MNEGNLRGQAPAVGAGSSPARFTALELAAAEQLIHLSESSSSGAAFTPRASAASAASSSSSLRSVNEPPAPLPALAAEDDEEDEQEVGGRGRRNKRYRSIAEIYAATEPKPIGARRDGVRKDRAKAAGAAKELEATRK